MACSCIKELSSLQAEACPGKTAALVSLDEGRGSHWTAHGEHTSPHQHTTAVAQYVFHRQGEQVKDFRKAWRKACRNAGIPDGRVFHDLWRTTARNLSRADVPKTI
jgi:hypothetical protein